MRARLQRLGVAHATVVAVDDRRLVVRAPGVDEGAAAALARQLASGSPLRFYDWEANVVGPRCHIDASDTEVTGGEHAGGPASGIDEAAARARAARFPGTIVVRARGVDADRWYVLRDRHGVTGAQIQHPSPFLDDGEAKVTFDFTPVGVRAWRRLTKVVAARDRQTASAGGDPQHVAVVLDDALLSTPAIAYRDYPDGIDASFGSQIDGGLTLRSADAVARAVRTGTYRRRWRSTTSAWLDSAAMHRRRLALLVAPLLALAAAPAVAQASTRTVTCVGGADACTATVPLAGLRTGDRIVVDLTDTDLQLAAVTPSSTRAQAAYGFAGMSTRLGGSQFVARILINPPVPSGATVRFRFGVPPKSSGCGDDQFTIDGAAIRLTAIRATHIACLAARRAAEGCVNGMGPGQGWTVLEVDKTVILQRKRQRVTFGLGNAGSSCAPSG